MREILFRGKAINRDNGYYRTSYKNGDWVYGLITRLYDERFETVSAEMKNTNGVSGIEVDYRTIGQYTGLTDKNGKKIFEGDILRYDAYNHRYVGFVEYNTAEFGVNSENASPFLSTAVVKYCATVIGNIHDNPELLKGGVNNG